MRTCQGIDGLQLPRQLSSVPLVVVVQQGDHGAVGRVDSELSASGGTAASALAQQYDSIVGRQGHSGICIRYNDDLRYRLRLIEHRLHSTSERRPPDRRDHRTYQWGHRRIGGPRKCTAQNNSAMQAYSAIMLYVHGE